MSTRIYIKKRALRISALAISIMMLFACMPMPGVQFADAEKPDKTASYIDSKGTNKQCDFVTDVKADDVEWNTGWYLTSGNTEIENKVKVSGNVRLILADGAKLTLNSGLDIDDEAKLIVYRQAQRTGLLDAGVSKVDEKSPSVIVFTKENPAGEEQTKDLCSTKENTKNEKQRNSLSPIKESETADGNHAITSGNNTETATIETETVNKQNTAEGSDPGENDITASEAPGIEGQRTANTPDKAAQAKSLTEQTTQAGNVPGKSNKTAKKTASVISATNKRTSTKNAQLKTTNVIYDAAQKILNVMRGWIGYSVANGKHKKIIDIYNSMKPLPSGYKMRYRDAWCDACISAAAIKAKLVPLIGRECGVGRHIEIFKKKGIWQENEKVVPKPGWIIVYNWNKFARNGQRNDSGASHIGIVEKVSSDKKTITTIEGNMRNAVRRRVIPVGWGYIRGYATPRYKTFGLTVKPIPDQDYTGEEVKPTPSVVLNKKALKINKDFRVKYSDNIVPGKAKVTVKGIKSHKFTVTKHFNINAPKPRQILRLTAQKKTSRTAYLSWTKISGADQYRIYYSKCSSKRGYRRLKTVNSDIHSLATGKLSQYYSYKFYVAALKDGKYLKRSQASHITLGTRLTNAKRVNVTKPEVTLKQGGTYKIKPSITDMVPGLKPVQHIRAYRFVSNNSVLAKVSREGIIRAEGVGTAYIYVMANNGVWKAVKVTVK